MSISRTVLSVAIAVSGVFCQSSQANDGQPTRSSIPYVATHSDSVRDMLWMANVGKDDVVYDLGSGDGRIVIAAVRDFGARRAVGIEIDPKLIQQSRKNAEKAGVADRIEFIQGDLFKQDFRQATVVTLFLGHGPNIRLRPNMFSAFRPGTRIVSHQFGMGEWKPDKTLRVRTAVFGMLGIGMGPFTFNPHVPDYIGNERHFDTSDDRIHCWLVPEAVAGVWHGKIETKDGPRDCQIVLHQRLSSVTGTFQVAGETNLTGDVTVELWGDHLRFSGRPKQMRYGAFELLFDGHVRDNTMEGTLAVSEQGRKRESQWEAQRERADFTGTWEWPHVTGEGNAKLRVERRNGAYAATYLYGKQSIPVTDFYDHGGGLYFTLRLRHNKDGQITQDAGWLLGEGTVEGGLLKGRIEFHPSAGGMALESTVGMETPKPIIQNAGG